MKLFLAYLLSLACVAAAVVSQTVTNPLARGGVYLAAAITAVFAFVLFRDWTRERWRRHLAEIRKWETMTETYRVIDALRYLTPEQLATLEYFKPVITYKVEFGAVIRSLQFGGRLIPWNFVEEYGRRSDKEYSAPTGENHWQTLAERENARALTSLIIQCRYAAPWNGGNKPARWINGGYYKFLCDFGLALPEPENELENE